MPAPYSLDLHQKALAALEAGHSKAAVSRLMGISRNQLVAPLTDEEDCHRAVFETWLEEQLVSALPYGSVIICEHASFHQGGRIEELSQQAGCSLLYLPPYSPNLNPLKHQWFVWKNRMRKQIQSGQPFRQVVDPAFIN